MGQSERWRMGGRSRQTSSYDACLAAGHGRAPRERNGRRRTASKPKEIAEMGGGLRGETLNEFYLQVFDPGRPVDFVVNFHRRLVRKHFVVYARVPDRELKVIGKSKTPSRRHRTDLTVATASVECRSRNWSPESVPDPGCPIVCFSPFGAGKLNGRRRIDKLRKFPCPMVLAN
jgi:hypothetical protein